MQVTFLPAFYTLQKVLMHAKGFFLQESNETGPRQAGELYPGEPHGIQQEQAQGPAPGEKQPPAPAQAGGDLLESGSAEKALAVLWGSEVTLSQHRALGAKGANSVLGCIQRSMARARRLLSPSALPQWGHIWSAASRSGPPSLRRTGNCLSKSRGELPRSWNISLVRKGWHTCAGSAWRREDWGGISSMLINI